MTASESYQFPLRAVLDESGGSLKNLTVLANQNDPFRVDTPARHRDGEWLAMQAKELGLGSRRIHLRGLHYALIGRPKPDGTPYTNTDKDWLWLQSDAAKAARWLGYIPFDQIIDQRNAAPTVRRFIQPYPQPYITVGIDVVIPSVEDIKPEIDVRAFWGVQPYHLVLFGEKSSLADVLEPIARHYEADLYLPTGEISDTLLHRMAVSAQHNGERPMVVLCFSDADPAGWQMPISIARKLQAFKVLLEDMPDFQVRRVALTPDQVTHYGLPSTPLKESERRADSWRAAMGVEQTEIDALASLQPALLRDIAERALNPFYDWTLGHRVEVARQHWLSEAKEIIDRDINSDQLARVMREAEDKLADMREQIHQLNDALRIDADDFDLPEIHIPEAHVDRDDGLPLLDSRWDFTDQCRRLKQSRDYSTAA